MEAGHNKNLTLRTSGGGKVNINDEDLTTLTTRLSGEMKKITLPSKHDHINRSDDISQVIERSTVGQCWPGDWRIWSQW